MQMSRIVEYVFFFSLLFLSGFMVWQLLAPFVSALALAAIIVVICYPLFTSILAITPRRNRSIAAFLSTMVVLMGIVLPIFLLSSVVVREVLSFYQALDGVQELSLEQHLAGLEAMLSGLIPGFEINLTEQLRQSAQWFAGNLGAIFAGTISTIFAFVIALIGSFYFFRDGKELLQLVVKASPLPDNEDHVIFERMAKAVRSVATGTILVALIQGTLVALGFWLFGVDRPIIWGSFASVGALMPGIGTSIVTFPAVAILFFTGNATNAIGLLIWSVTIVGLIDNLIGPYLIGRGNNMHPFIVLLSVLGGISVFGPIGFILGPVIVTLFLVLLEIYNLYIIKDQSLDPQGKQHGTKR